MRAALVIALLAAGCTTVTVRAPPCEPAPLPPAALEPCDLPAPIADGQLETLYLQAFIDTALIKCWAKRFNNLKAQIAFRDAKLKECQAGAQAPAKSWWQF